MKLYQRSRLLVDPKVQWPIACRLFVHWMLFLFCLVSINAMIRIMLSGGDQPFWSVFWPAIEAQAPIFAMMMMMMPVFLRDSLKLSNRFAGPMFRLRGGLSLLAQKQAGEPIKFRKGDFWHDAAADFNTVREELESLRSENERLNLELNRVAETASL